MDQHEPANAGGLDFAIRDEVVEAAHGKRQELGGFALRVQEFGLLVFIVGLLGRSMFVYVMSISSKSISEILLMST